MRVLTVSHLQPLAMKKFGRDGIYNVFYDKIELFLSKMIYFSDNIARNRQEVSGRAL